MSQIHGPASEAPTVSNLVAHCNVCGVEWHVKATEPPYDDAQGCALCDAPKEAITLVSEKPTYGSGSRLQ